MRSQEEIRRAKHALLATVSNEQASAHARAVMLGQVDVLDWMLENATIGFDVALAAMHETAARRAHRSRAATGRARRSAPLSTPADPEKTAAGRSRPNQPPTNRL